MKMLLSNLIFCFDNYNWNPAILEIANKSDWYIKVREDLRENGLVNPLLVEDLNNGKYKVWIGNTRLAGAQKLGWKFIDVEVITDITPKGLKEYRDNNYKKTNVDHGK